MHLVLANDVWIEIRGVHHVFLSVTSASWVLASDAPFSCKLETLHLSPAN